MKVKKKSFIISGSRQTVRTRMRYAILKEHIHFFLRQGYVEFEDFLSQEQIALLRKEIRQALHKRNPAGPRETERDLWRDHVPLQQQICHPNFVKIGSEILQTRRMRLAWDQFFPLIPPLKNSEDLPEAVAAPSCLEEISSVREILGAWILPLEDNPSEEPSFFPKKAGDALFVAANTPIPLEERKQPLYVIAFCGVHANYRTIAKDPHSYHLKRLGYVEGERLKDSLHPILVR